MQNDILGQTHLLLPKKKKKKLSRISRQTQKFNTKFRHQTTKKKSTLENFFFERDDDEELPVTSPGVSTHRRDLKSWSQIHPSVFLLLLVRTAEQSCYWPWLLGLLEAMHEPHSLPIEVVLALHREQRVNPPWSLLTRFHTLNSQTHQSQHHH